MIAPELETRDVGWEHVKGHAGHPLNETVDSLARRAASQIPGSNSSKAKGYRP